MDAVKELAEDLGEVAEGALDAYLEGEDGVEDEIDALLATLLSLAVVDSEGNVVVDEDGQPVRPFAVFDPANLPAEWLGWNLRRVIFEDPETDAPVVEAAPEIPAE